MTIGMLKRRIENLKDDVVVVTSGYDHSYREVHGTVVPAEKYESKVDKEYSEYWDEESMLEGSELVDVFLID